MVATTYHRGHLIYYNEERKEWLYADDNTSSSVERPCKKCGHMPLETGEDYCVGHLYGVKSACCGHGVQEEFIMYENGTIVRGKICNTKHKKQ